MKLSLVSLILCIAYSATAQNLVLNPGFELTTACPAGAGNFTNAINWSNGGASTFSCASPDLIAGCAPVSGGVNSPSMILGYQPSHTGSNHAGLILYESFFSGTCITNNYREYISGELSAPLQAGENYCVSFYINRANGSNWATDKIGVYLSDTAIAHPYNCPTNTILPVVPQLTYSGAPIIDTVNWIRLEWNYTATGGEQYFAIGNFESTPNTTSTIVGNCNNTTLFPFAYYFVDDVSIIPGTCPGLNCTISSSHTTQNVSCFGLSDGCAVLQPTSDGSGMYSYLWSTGATTDSICNLSAGNYTVTISDTTSAGGYCSVMDTIIITAPDSLEISSVVSSATCGEPIGGIDLSVQGGTMPYTFNWSNSQSTEDLTNLAEGIYSITLSDANNCEIIENIIVNGSDSLTSSQTIGNATCQGSDGSIDLTIGGGTAPYSFIWSNGQSSEDLNNLAGNSNYSVTVTDIDGCRLELSSIHIDQDSLLEVKLDEVIPNSCGASDGLISILVSGGSGNYTFSWSNGATTQNLTGLGISSDPLQNNYTVNVNDAASGCSGTLTATAQGSLLDPLNPFIGAIGVTDSSIYVGETINVDAGTNQSGVTYTWTGPIDVNFDNANIAATLAGSDVAGEYTLTITATDTFNCTVNDTLHLEVLEDNPQIPDAFTPDDPTNDNHIFKVEGMNDVSNILEFSVYNRWGQLIYNNEDGAAQWDGTYKGAAQPRDVYIYVISWQRPQDAEPVVTRGEVTLLR